MVVPFYNPTNNAQGSKGFQFLYILTTLVIFWLFLKFQIYIYILLKHSWLTVFPWTCFHLLSQFTLLVGAFNTFTFKVIINIRYYLLIINLIIIKRSYYHFSFLLLVLCFLPREVPLAFVGKLIWCCWTLLTFACL